MPLSGNPNVKITFTGLLVFSFNPDKPECQIGVLKVPLHQLRIETGKKTPQTPSPELLSIKPEAEISAGPIRIEVTEPQIKGLIMYFDSKFTGIPKDNPYDFRWLIDVEGEKFHNKALPIKEGSLSPIISLDNGFFYTDEIRTVSVTRPGAAAAISGQKIANTIGVNIYFDSPESELVLSFGTDGAQKLTLKNEPGTTHLIAISNDCPSQFAPPPPPPTAPPLQSNAVEEEIEIDFKFFYEAFNIPEGERFVLKFKESDEADTVGHPCGPIRTGLTTNLSTN